MSFAVRSRAARLLLAAAPLVLLAACGDDPAGPGAAAYSATTFQVTPTGQTPIDVLAAGGSLSIAIASNNAVTGSLVLPASVTGGAAMNASMNGTAIRSGSTIEFEQSADTFVRDLVWTVEGTTLRVVNQQAGAARFTITLTRQ